MRRFLRAMTGVIVIAALATVVARTGVMGGAMQRLALDIAAPVLDALAYPLRMLGAGWSALGEQHALRQSNAALQQRCDDLERQLAAATDAAHRIGQLEEIVGLREQYPELQMARIVLRDDLPWRKTIVINGGTRDGLVRDMAVVAGAGLVGKIVSVGYAYARVVVMTDPTFKAGGRLQHSRYTGLIEGGGASTLTLNYLPLDAEIVPGDQVLTSGLGGIFPSGYLIGIVRDVAPGEGGFYQFATVAPAVDINRLEYVAVIKRLPPQLDDGSTRE
jgi:rod shape-determining protein MreC